MSIGNRGGASAPKLGQQQDSGSQGQAGQQSTQNDQPNASRDKAQIALIPNAPAIVTNGTEVQAERDQQRADADLQAQQDMAFYALLMLIATVASVAITAAGVWFVKRTLDATLEAVKDTGRATNAMIRQTDLAEDTAERQLRAYLVTAGLEHEWCINPLNGERSVALRVKFVNSGQTPALEVKFECKLSFDAIPDNLLEWELSPQDTITVAGPGVPLDAPSIFMAEADANAVHLGQKTAYLFGIATYRDCFGSMRETRFLWQITFGKTENVQVLDRSRWRCVGTHNTAT